MADDIRLPENAALVIDHFGYWPDFHDAEILRLQLDRDFPVGSSRALLRVFAFEMTDKIAGRSYQRIKHCIIEFELAGYLDCDLAGFNHQNALLALEFCIENDRPTCQLHGAYGLDGFIRATSIRVNSLRPLSRDQCR